MAIHQGALHGLWIFEQPIHQDERGFFHEAFRVADLETALGRRMLFLQMNHSRSLRGVLRGLHSRRLGEARIRSKR